MKKKKKGSAGLNWGLLSEAESREAEKYLRRLPDFDYKAWQKRKGPKELMEKIQMGRSNRNDSVMAVLIEITNSQLKDQGRLAAERQARLMRVIYELLKFKSGEGVKAWLLKPNKQFGNLPPIDLVNSEYATRHLMKVIRGIKIL